MTNFRNFALAATLSRLTLGTVMLAHSFYLKLVVFTLAGTANFFSSIGLPEFLAYLVFCVEALCGVALILGYKTQWAALALIPILLGATWAHWGSGWLFTNHGGGWEYPLVLLIMTGVQILLGNGHYSITKDQA